MRISSEATVVLFLTTLSFQFRTLISHQSVSAPVYHSAMYQHNFKYGRGAGFIFVGTGHNIVGRILFGQSIGRFSRRQRSNFHLYQHSEFHSSYAVGQVLDLKETKCRAGIQMATDCRTSNSPQKLVVVGGGAAGFMAAIEAARGSKEASVDLEVTILEASARVLQKVKISGGGRCNVLHDKRKGIKTISEGLVSNALACSSFSKFAFISTLVYLGILEDKRLSSELSHALDRRKQPNGFERRCPCIFSSLFRFARH